MGHGHEPPYSVPKYTEFQVKGIPELEELEAALARKGLKDPWIRNEAWRYHPGFGSKWARARALFFRGAPLGIALAGLTVVATKMLSKDDPHGEGHGAHGHDKPAAH